MNKLSKFLIILLISCINFSHAENIKKIEVFGNERISTETIKMFSNVLEKDFLNENDINDILKRVYNTNFFEDVNVKFENQILTISVKENPIIENLIIEGIKSDNIKEIIQKQLQLKSRSSFNRFLLNKDVNSIKIILKELGYYFVNIDSLVENLNENKINLTHKIILGKKAKIKKITFLGDKIFKDKKLKSIIVSEEYKFWKFISGKKYLNESTVQLDQRLLKNFYLNKGYYNVSISSSFAKLVNDSEFELIYNITANDKIYFDNISLNLPIDFNKENFTKLNNVLDDLKNKPYSRIEIEKIIKEIENLSLTEEYESINVSFDENLFKNKLNLTINIFKDETFYVNRINIFGNNITNENVIRNQFMIDEGDPFNEILYSKSINELRRLNFFREVTGKIIENEDKSKTINISVEEKPTGEISLGAGFGTSGTSFSFSIKENNFLGNGIALDTSLLVSDNSIKGQFGITQPNYKNSDKLVFYNIQAIETDRLSDYGYKSNKVGFSVGSNFEYYDDFFLGIGIDNYLEKIETSSSASTKQKSQSGNYWDTFLNLDFNYDKRNQKFETTSGYYNFYNVKVPIISKSASLINELNYKYFAELYENNITSAAISLGAANSLNNKNIKLSERLFIPGRKLRGFEAGKVGPKDGNDFIGGNYISTLNIVSNLPKLFENYQNLDFILFFDAANIWGVDYDTTKNKSGIRSSIGVGLDWSTPVGPLNFSLAQPLSKENTDIVENFRFNLGTSF